MSKLIVRISAEPEDGSYPPSWVKFSVESLEPSLFTDRNIAPMIHMLAAQLLANKEAKK